MIFSPSCRRAFCLSAALLAFSAFAEEIPDHTAEKYKTNFPPSAELSYSVKARQSGLALGGSTNIKWQTGGGHFTVATETRANLFGKIADATTEGVIDAYGLAPVTFNEKRFHKDATETLFDREKKQISFNSSEQAYPLKGGEQDRNSAVWQLIAVARAAPEKFKPGSQWHFFVAGTRDADPWTFKVDSTEKIDTPQGSFKTLHVLKTTNDNKTQRVEIWLAPSLEWYPVRLRYTDPDGDYVEQTLTSVTRKQE